MAKTKKAPKKAAHRFKAKVGRSSDKKKTTTPRRPRQAVDQELPIEGGVRDAALMKWAKTYAQTMGESEEALVDATKAKQQIRTRMGALDATIFTAHGYEFSRTVSEESFSARKIKRGTKPADTEPAPIPVKVGDDRGVDAPFEE